MSLWRVAALLLLVSIAHAAQDAETNRDQYMVLQVNAHEYTVCRGVTMAVGLEDGGDYKGCDVLDEVVKAFKEKDKCDVIATFGGDGASISAHVQDMVADVKSIGPKIKQFAQTMGAKITDLFKFRSLRKKRKLPDVLKSYTRLYAALVKGAREPDLPCADRDDFSKYNCLISLLAGGAAAKVQEVKLGLEQKPSDVIAYLATNAEIKGFSPAARASHFGALSIGHCQTASRPPPENLGVPGVVEALKDPNIFKGIYDFGYDKPANPDPKQKDVAEAIIALLSHFYKLGVNFGAQKRVGHFVAMLSRLGHTTGDSFSCSHTIREAKTMKLLYFQDYGAQDGKKHSVSGDELTGKAPFDQSKDKPLRGFYKAMDHISVAFQIAIRDVCSQRLKKPYKPVFPGSATPLEELQKYYRSEVLSFAGDAFANYPAAGCVTKGSAQETDKARARICKFAETAAGLKAQAFTICPDRPLDAKADLA